jgi:hypothetical protein
MVEREIMVERTFEERRVEVEGRVVDKMAVKGGVKKSGLQNDAERKV